MIGPLARVLLRYGVGGAFVLAGYDQIKATEIGTMLAENPDMVVVVSGALAGLVEVFYALAKRYGWRT